LIERIVDLAENLTPIALTGVGGIGKTSIALTVLHHKRIKQRFGDNRRFTRCDQFTASYPQFLSQLSKVIGAGVENPESLATLRPFLSSREILIVLDNAESILDPQGTDAQEIYAAVEELSQLDGICLCITSRISTIPADCETLDIPTLSIDAARDAFHRIHKNSERSSLIDNILEQLDFHPLSITLLATVAHHNKWGTARLAGEWEKRRTSVLQTEHNRSLAAAIELSLASLMFQEIGPDARGLLGVVAFFPQGVDENNIDWLFPTISSGANIIDKFCILSLAYRSNGFVMMLAPLRDYLSPKDPKSSPLLCMAKERYFTRLSVNIDPDKPNFRETRWITSEDVNVEHLLDIFTTVDPNSDGVWNACAKFTEHLYWHKKRVTILQLKIEGLPDDYNFKPGCLYGISQLFSSAGNHTERKRLLTHALKLLRERGSIQGVAEALRNLSDANRQMGLPEEGIQQAKEALEIYERLDDTVAQVDCLVDLAFLLRDSGQLDAAEEAAFRAINLLPEKGQEFMVCKSHRLLGVIYQSKGEIDKAIHHFELALGIASTFDWHGSLFWNHYNLAGLFRKEGRLEDAQAHVEHAKSHVANNTHLSALAMEEQAWVWYRQHRLEEAKSEALCAADLYEKAGAARDLEDCRELLRRIEEELNSPAASDCELL
jgi:tetratricopeptide (TPR) repeat protein